MRHPCCLWLEHFAIQRLEGELPELRGQPVALFNGRQRLVQANAEARTGGIRPGMRAREAAARLADLALFPVPPADDGLRALRTVAGELLTFSPAVATWGEEEIVVDLAPSAHLFGGAEALAGRLVQAVDEAGWSCRAAAAPSLAAARLAARLQAEPGRATLLTAPRERRFLRELPLAALTTLPEFLGADREQRLFAYLDVHTLGDLAAIPAHAVRETFRPDEQEILLYARREASLARHLEPVHQAPSLTLTLPFFPPLTDVEQLLPALEEAYGQLQERLFRRRLLLATLTLVLVTEDLDEQPLHLALARPSRDPRLLLSLTRLKLGEVRLRRPLDECRVEATELAREAPRSRDLLASARTANHLTLDELCSRLDARLGRRGSLFRLALRPQHRPDESWGREEVAEGAQAPAGAVRSGSATFAVAPPRSQNPPASGLQHARHGTGPAGPAGKVAEHGAQGSRGSHGEHLASHGTGPAGLSAKSRTMVRNDWGERQESTLPATAQALPASHERAADLPCLLVAEGGRVTVPAARVGVRVPEFLFEHYDPAALGVVRVEYHRMRRGERTVLVRVEGRDDGVVVGVED